MVKNYSKFCLARPLSSERSCYSHNALLRIWQAGTHFWQFDSNEYQCHASHSRFLLKSDQKCKIWLRDIQHLEFQHVDFRHYWTFNIWTFNIIRLSTFLEFSNFRILKLLKYSSYNYPRIQTSRTYKGSLGSLRHISDFPVSPSFVDQGEGVCLVWGV